MTWAARQSSPASSDRRRGYTLMEMLAVISLLGVLLPATGIMLHLLVKAELATRAEQVSGQTLMSLADAFRRDVRGCEDGARLENDRELLLPAGSGQLIRYCLKSDGVERILWDADGVRRHRELFRLPGCTAALRRDEAVWTLVVRRPAIFLTEPGSKSSTFHEFPIRATLNAHP